MVGIECLDREIDRFEPHVHECFGCWRPYIHAIVKRVHRHRLATDHGVRLADFHAVEQYGHCQASCEPSAAVSVVSAFSVASGVDSPGVSALSSTVASDALSCTCLTPARLRPVKRWTRPERHSRPERPRRSEPPPRHAHRSSPPGSERRQSWPCPPGKTPSDPDSPPTWPAPRTGKKQADTSAPYRNWVPGPEYSRPHRPDRRTPRACSNSAPARIGRNARRPAIRLPSPRRRTCCRSA